MAPRVDKKDTGKRRVDLLAWPEILELADVMTFGATKYADRGYYGLEAMRVFGAAVRHLGAWVTLEDFDQETGLHHTAHAMANCMMLGEMQRTGEWVDDRPARSEYSLKTVACTTPAA